ncbi:MAG: putative DNA-binding domain-containing protein [Alphaproteobacteria bacterium]|nr:putative DNA-binding domain-containing protein [Alphaproteobacteria bacterium]
MLALRDLQGDFAEALRGGRASPRLAALITPDLARLDVYRNTARTVAIEALRIGFPATEAIVGEEFFALAAAKFWRVHPPREAWLGAWGDELGNFLGRMHAARAVAYLADVARFERALSRAANAADIPALDAASLASVPPEQHPRLRFTPHPSVTLLRLRYPADAIADAVRAGDDAAMAAIDLGSGPVHLLVHRAGGEVVAERIGASAWRFLRVLFAGTPLGEVLAGAPARLDAASMLAAQFARGRLAAAAVKERAPCDA